jgi:peptidoglycan/LPS O-acetylase OafA/YrhL
MWFLAYLAACLVTSGLAAHWIASDNPWTWFICTFVFLAGNFYGLLEARYRFGMRSPNDRDPGQNR